MSDLTGSSAEALVGTRLAEGRYELVRLLGEGGMGAVYEARQVAMDRLVALKLIRSEVVQSGDAAARFEREMKVTAKIEHPNTIRVYDYGKTDGRLFLTMEFLRGKSLKRVIEETGGPIALIRLVRIGTQMAKGLGAAHAAGVVHRDLKPDNVMVLDSYGEPDFVKVLDFGIAKSLDENATQMTTPGGAIGTPAYMSPEQALGRDIDARTDLYSFGVMLYELASGRVPFKAQTIPGLLVAHATEPPPPLDEVVPGINPELARLVMQLLEKDPAARPQSAREVEERLAALVAPSTRVPATRIVVPTPPRSNSGVVAGVLGVVLAVGGVGAFFALRPTARNHGANPPPLDQAAQQRRDAIDALAVKLGDPAVPAQCQLRDPAALARLEPALTALAQGPDNSALALKTLGDGPAASAEEEVARSRALLGSDATRSLAAASEARKLCPSWAVTDNQVGKALKRLGKLDDAAAAFSRAIAEAPDYDAPRFNLAMVQLARKDPLAVPTLEELIKRKPAYPDAYLVLAQARAINGDIAHALKDAEEAARRASDSGDAWKLLAGLREQAGRSDAKEAWCRAKALKVPSADAKCP